MPKTFDSVEAVFAEAARAAHPTDGPLHVALSRIATLERRVDFLSSRVDLLVDLLNEADNRD